MNKNLTRINRQFRDLRKFANIASFGKFGKINTKISSFGKISSCCQNLPTILSFSEIFQIFRLLQNIGILPKAANNFEFSETLAKNFEFCQKISSFSKIYQNFQFCQHFPKISSFAKIYQNFRIFSKIFWLTFRFSAKITIIFFTCKKIVRLSAPDYPEHSWSFMNSKKKWSWKSSHSNNLFLGEKKITKKLRKNKKEIPKISSSASEAWHSSYIVSNHE